MSNLSPKQEAFAQAVADGMTQADAYRAAYKAGGSPKTCQEAASRLMANSNINARVNELKAQLQNKALWTREMSVKALVAAYREGSAGVKVSAVKELNTMHGFNAPQKVDLTNSDGSLKPTLIQLVPLNANRTDSPT